MRQLIFRCLKECLFFQFFVAADPTVKNDRLWHDKYSLRKSMIPTFISTDQAKKVNLSFTFKKIGI